MKLIIIGIGTEVGKTVVSTILVQALKADYWKPVQAGNLHATDSMFVKKYLGNKKSIVFKEAFSLKEPISPHEAARLQGIHITMESFVFPKTKNILLIESAGGLMSPINGEQTFLDFVLLFKLPVVVVSKHYLGSINHTLLTIDVLQKHNVRILGIVFNGEKNVSTESYIMSKTNVHQIGRVPFVKEINKSFVRSTAEVLMPGIRRYIDE